MTRRPILNGQTLDAASVHSALSTRDLTQPLVRTEP